MYNQNENNNENRTNEVNGNNYGNQNNYQGERSGEVHTSPDGYYHYRPQNSSSSNYTYPYRNNQNSNYSGQNSYYQPQGYNQNYGQGYYTPYQPVKPAKEKTEDKNKGKKILVFALSMLLSCLIAFGASFGTLSYMISSGAIQIEDTDESKVNAVFTITKVEKEEEIKNDTPAGTIKKLTNQEVAQKLIPSVVCIQNYQVVEYYNFFGGTQKSDEVSPAGEGSGIIFSQDGYIITNAHVVDGADNLKVITSDGTTYEAVLIGSDAITDIAVIKIDAENLPAAEFGKAEDLSVADTVIAIGNPGGMTFNSSVTIGYVSALNREISVGDGGYTMECIQTDAAINPGNSGGALVNEYGLVVGVNSAKFVSEGYEGLGFAIPSETVLDIASDLINYGYVKDRAILGINGQFVDSVSSRFYGLSVGMYVYDFVSDEAANSGLEKYDVITSIDGIEITSSNTITNYLTKKKPGDTVTLTVDRALENKKDITITVVLSEYEQ